MLLPQRQKRGGGAGARGRSKLFRFKWWWLITTMFSSLDLWRRHGFEGVVWQGGLWLWAKVPSQPGSAESIAMMCERNFVTSKSCHSSLGICCFLSYTHTHTHFMQLLVLWLKIFQNHVLQKLHCQHGGNQLIGSVRWILSNTVIMLSRLWEFHKEYHRTKCQEAVFTKLESLISFFNNKINLICPLM